MNSLARSAVAKERHVSVDSFRGLAALAVVCAHIQCGIEFADISSTDEVHQSIGALLLYLFRGSSAYFMVITGFVLASRLPAWKRQPSGLIMRAVQRMTKILIIYWIALAIIMTINLTRYSIFGTAWVKPTFMEAFSQYFLFSNFMRTDQLYIAASWYLEADFILFTSVILLYACWNRLPERYLRQLKPFVFISTILLVLISNYIESLNPFSRFLYAPIRLSTYFILGFLAWHAKTYASAMFSLIVCSMLVLFWNNLTVLYQHFFTSNAVVLAFVFYASHYSFPLKVLCSHPLIVNLYKINFSLFLFNVFAIIVGISFARHIAPDSIPALFVFLSLALLTLFTGCYYFERLIQRPTLAWHDRMWKYLLNRFMPRQEQRYALTTGRVVIDTERMRGELSAVHSAIRQ